MGLLFQCLRNESYILQGSFLSFNVTPASTTHFNVDGFYIDMHLVQIERKDMCKVSKGAKIRNRYNQVPHLHQDTDGKVTNSQLDTTNESQDVSPFPAGDHKSHINRRAQRRKHKTEKKDPQKK